MTNLPTYRIAAVGDFLKVPPDRRAACLREFAATLEVIAGLDALVREVAVDLAARDGVTLPEGPIHGLPEWTWCDDGRRDQEVTYADQEDRR